MPYALLRFYRISQPIGVSILRNLTTTSDDIIPCPSSMLSYVRSSLKADWQSFNTRTIGREPVSRNHALAYGMVAVVIIFTTEYPADFAGAPVQLFLSLHVSLSASCSRYCLPAFPHAQTQKNLPEYRQAHCQPLSL